METGRKRALTGAVLLGAAAAAVVLWARTAVGSPQELQAAAIAARSSVSVEHRESARGGDVRPARRLSTADAALPVVVLDAMTGRPVSTARLSWSEPRDGVAVTDAQGRAILPATAAAAPELRISAADYVVACWRGSVEPGQRIELEPAARLRLRFLDPEGGPLVGIRARLLPPVVGGLDYGVDAGAFDPAALASATPGDDDRLRLRGYEFAGRFRDLAALVPWEQTTDASGSIAWSQLPPGPGYRWVLLSAIGADPVPPHERLRPRFDGEGVHVDPAPPRALSGVIELVARQSVDLEIACPALAVITGRLPVRPGKAAQRSVVLYDFEWFANPHGGKDFARSVEEQRAAVDGEGRFRFDDVRPGRKVVQAFWQSDNAWCFEFARQVLELAPGAVRDLSPLPRVSGACELVARVVCAAAEGARIDPELLAPLGVPVALLHLSVRERGPVLHSLSDGLPVPLGQPITVRGLPAGEVSLHAALHPGARSRLRNPDLIVEPEAPRSVTLEPGRSTREALTLTTTAPEVVDLDFVPPFATEIRSLQLWLRSHGTRRVTRYSTPPRADGASVFRSRFALPAGTYDVFARGIDGDGRRDVAGLAAIRVAAGAGRQTISLQPAARVWGIAAGGSRLRWSPAAMAPDETGVWIYDTEADADGRFELGAVLPEVEFVGAEGLPALRVPGAGEQQIVLSP